MASTLAYGSTTPCFAASWNAISGSSVPSICRCSSAFGRLTIICSIGIVMACPAPLVQLEPRPQDACDVAYENEGGAPQPSVDGDEVHAVEGHVHETRQAPFDRHAAAHQIAHQAAHGRIAAQRYQ